MVSKSNRNSASMSIVVTDKNNQAVYLSSAITRMVAEGKDSLTIDVLPRVQATLYDDVSMYQDKNIALEVIVHEDARVRLVMQALPPSMGTKIDDEGDNVIPARQTSMTDCKTDDAQKMKINRTVAVRLAGARAHAEVLCVCLGTEQQKFMFKFLQDHQAPHTTSDVVVKSVLMDESTLSCHGLIHIKPAAQHTDAQLSNKNILLGDKTRAVSVPTLEIEANEVVCKHGAAVSRLDDNHLFYLQSRGMSPQAAQDMLVNSFLHVG